MPRSVLRALSRKLRSPPIAWFAAASPSGPHGAGARGDAVGAWVAGVGATGGTCGAGGDAGGDGGGAGGVACAAGCAGGLSAAFFFFLPQPNIIARYSSWWRH